jgi:quinol monooxygenase YgiN
MQKNSLRVLVRVKARNDKVDELRALLKAVVAPSRNEQGCISFELLQSQRDPTDFVFVEEWESAAALEGHSASEHVNHLRAKLTTLQDGERESRRYSVVA